MNRSLVARPLGEKTTKNPISCFSMKFGTIGFNSCWIFKQTAKYFTAGDNKYFVDDNNELASVETFNGFKYWYKKGQFQIS